MTEAWITCPMCGHVFDAEKHAACRACPMQKNCHLVCCPVCGYESVDPGRSFLARAAARWLFAGAADETIPGPEKPTRSTEK